MERKLRIVVIGYYGKRNAGDDLLQQSLCSVLQGHHLLFTSWFPGMDVLNRADLVVVGGGSIWPGNPFFQSGDAIARELRTPFIVVGVSAKSHDAAVASKTKKLIDKALWFHVRDAASAAVIGDDRISVGADLYWWSAHAVPACDGRSESVALNLRSWTAADWDPAALVKETARHTDTILPLPLYFDEQGHETTGSCGDDILLRSLGIERVPESFAPALLADAGLVVAMRFHALLIAVRCGLPVVGFSYHAKTIEFFREYDMDNLCVPLDAPAALGSALEEVAGNRTEYGHRSLEIAQRCLRQAADDRAHFRSLLSSVEPKPRHRIRSALRSVLPKSRRV